MGSRSLKSATNEGIWRGRIRLNKTHTGQIIGGDRNRLNLKNTYPGSWMLVFAGRLLTKLHKTT